jgi:SAM-dependent methyltransferase
LPPLKAAPADYGVDVVRERHAKFARTLQRVVALEPSARTVLDVGAATGDFVRIALDRGFLAEGIEMSEYATQRASEINGVALRRCTLDEVSGEARYDCIHLNHVFEHFNDPARELAHLRRLLRVGGLLYLEIPYQFQIVEKLLFRLRGGIPEFTVHSLHHPFFYTPSTLSRIVVENGFEVVTLSVFDAERAQPTTLLGSLKKRFWQACAYASIGNYIELWARRSA